MCTAGFPEPKTFSSRVARLLRERADDFDIVHDNQVLGYGHAGDRAYGLPLITTIHHPITIDRRIDLADRAHPAQGLTLRRWYGFLRMQGKVARQAAQDPDAVGDLAARHRARLRRRPRADRRSSCSASTTSSRRRPTPRVPGRILAMASADAPMKGIATLLEAFAKLRIERDISLVLVTKPEPGGRTEQLIDQLGIADPVTLRAAASATHELVEVMGSAEVACVPSLYEGFSLPDRRADGLRDAAGRLARRRHPRGRRPRRRVRRPGDPRRRRRAGGRDRGAARRPRATCDDGRGRPRPRRRSCSAGVPWPRPPPPPTRRRSPPSSASRAGVSRRRAASADR